MKKLLRTGGLAVAALLSIGASGNWNTTVVDTDRGYLFGNPEAEVTLIEFASYTCPHCAHFTNEGEPALQLAYIGPGKLKFEIRPFVRNVVDLVASRLVECGGEEKSLQTHTMFMTRQPYWLARAQNATPAQVQIWTKGDAYGFRAVASSLGFYDMMESRGVNRVAVDKCLADKPAIDALIANTKADAVEYGVKGTPSFALNGKLLDGVHGWEPLEKVLKSQF
ncbi:thioredoxin domain-containing protein [Altererythrobacter arenosus]|uniref:Thioredoxin domain-containing protein n=1 Tax=Altererythrobacter arenosus TaxID=3032592 RepID=A0ABY8FR16_9SPHN|nr:thioredoxin domain-containing protein [Altererythrobacter sp. CAU 1644]WFL76550.1 thioredoxin domain-containing protein [Altererythrobacter sp. CAU 1644]